ncbi:MAG TPA: hypothetical protein DCQ93_10235 [Bacteroidetes bacterium]|nr:hypothetical protein [Bacteroidota bacterium]
MARIILKSTLKVKQVIMLKRTLRFTTAGTACAALILGLFFFTGNMTQSSDVRANTTGGDTLITHSNANTANSDSLVNWKKKTGASSEDNDHMLQNSDLLQSEKKSKKKSAHNNGNRNPETFSDFITISPVQTEGVFEIRFETPSEQTENSTIDIVDRKGKVIETRRLEQGVGIINEVFTLDTNIPNGVYLVKIKSGKNQYIRQVVKKA